MVYKNFKIFIVFKNYDIEFCVKSIKYTIINIISRKTAFYLTFNYYFNLNIAYITYT